MAVIKTKEQYVEKRKLPRRKCKKTVGYATYYSSHAEYIYNINSWGVYIEADDPPDVDDNIVITIPITENKDFIKIIGKVVRKDRLGFGVKFEIGMSDSVINNIIK